MKPSVWNVVVLALLLVVSMAGATNPVSLQNSDAQVDGIVGVWREQVTARNCETGEEILTFSVLSTFAQGGTLTAMATMPSPALRGPAFGYWQHEGGNTYTHVHEALLFNAEGAWTGTQRVMVTHVIGDNPDERTSEAQNETFDTEGNLLMSGCATAVSQRMK